MNIYKHFNYWLVILTSSLSVLVFGLNWFLNPYGVTNSPKVKNVNWYKPATIDRTRLYKAVDLTRYNVKTLLLGASRIEYGLNPEHPGLKQYQPVYNLGLVGATIYEQRRYLEYAIANQPDLELVILGIDLWLVDEDQKTKQGFSEARLQNEGLDWLEFFQVNYSLSTLIESKEAFTGNFSGQIDEFHNEKGLIVIRNLPDEIFARWLPRQVNRKNYAVNPFALDNLKQIQEICQDNDIKLIALITPPHVSHVEGIYMAGFGSVIEQMKREIVKIMPVWDFHGYNSITTEPIDQVTNYWDSSHYGLEIGDLILNRVLNYQEQTVPPDFGMIITPANVEAELEKMQINREKWLQQDAETLKFLQNLVKD